MSETPGKHPGDHNLSDFGLGRLTLSESQEIEAHLEACPACCTRVEDLPDDTFVLFLRDSVHAPVALPLAATEAGTLAACQAGSSSTSATPTAGSPDAGSVPVELAAHGRYRILEVLGSGGMGTVYRARHLFMERDVALKVINPTLMESPTLVERFRREVKTAARLAHPNIVTAYDAEQAGDWHFLVMEYVPGISLSRLVAEKGKLPVVEACDYARQAALGLQHAFERDMVHRDIKPQNLMLTPAGQVKILDFGLSRLGNEIAPGASGGLTAAGREQGGLAAGSLTQAGCVMGTPDYIAPEQVRDAHAADIRADVYSLGCTLYHLLAGNPPFAGVTDFDKVLAHLERTPPPLREQRPDVPVKLATVVARMMARSPQDRYQTPAEAAQALAPFAGVAPSARSRRFWGLAAAVLFVLVAGLGVVSFMTGKRNRAPEHPSGPAAPAGEIIVEAPDKAGLLEMRQAGRRVHVLDLQNESSCRIDPGSYDLSLTNAPEYLYLPVERCQVAEGTPTTIRIRKVEVVREFRGPTQGDLACVACTPDGKRVLAGGHGNTLRMWDAEGKVLRVFPTHPNNDVLAVAVSPDGRSVAWGAGPLLILSDLETGAEITFKGHQGTLLAVAFSPDGTRLLSGATDRTMRLWDVKSRQQLGDSLSLAVTYAKRTAGEVCSVAFTPDGLYALSGRLVWYGGHVPLQLWDLQERRDVHRLDDSRGTFRQHVAILSADGRRVLAGCNKEMILWDLETGKKLADFLGHKGRVCSVAFLPDGRRVLSGGDDGTARVWDAASGRELYRFTKHEGAINAVAVAPDGCHALTAGHDRVVRLWRMPVPDPVARPPETRGELVVATPENAGLLVIRRGGRRVRVLDLQSERSCKLEAGDYDFSLTDAPDDLTLLVKHCHLAPGAKATIRIDSGKVLGVYKGITTPGGGVCVAVSPDGKRVFAGGWGNPLRMWDVATGKERVFACPGPSDVFGIAVAPDGKSVAWGAGPIVRLSDPESGKEIGTFKGHTRTVWGLAFSPDGTRLVSVADDGTMRLWEVKSRRQLDVFRVAKGLTTVAFAPDGQHALVSLAVHGKDQAALQLWDLQARRDEHRLEASRGMGQFCLAALSGDGRRVLAGCNDKLLRLWDLKTGKELQHFAGHSNTVRNMAFLPDGHRVLSVSYDGTAKVWDEASGRCLYTFTKHRGAIKGVALAPDGHAFTVDDAGLVIRWRLPRADPAPKR